MARAHLRYIVHDGKGNVVQNAGANVYRPGTSAAAYGAMYSAETGGTTLTNPLISNNQGEIQAWLDIPQIVELEITDNAAQAYYPDAAGTKLSWTAFRESANVIPSAKDLPIRINVDGYGPGGDGTDATAAITAAFTAAQKNVSGIRQIEIVFGAGIYLTDPQVISNSNNRSALHIRGAGRSNTVLKLKNSANGVLLDVGGATVGGAVNQIHISDLTLDGNRANQTVANPTLRMRRVDRSWLTRVQVQESKGDGAEVDASALVMDECEFSNNDGDGLQFDDSNSISGRDCFYEHNAGYGVRGLFTGTIALLGSKDEAQALFTGGHFEDNTLGDILINGVDNVRITGGNLFASPKTGVTKAVEFIGECRWGSVTENTFVWKSDIATYDDGTGAVGQRYAIKFGSQTSECAYGNNAGYGVSFKEGGSTGIVEMLPQVQDLGANYSVDPTRGNLRQIEGQGGHTLLGWTDEPVTNFLKDSADLTTARWTAVNIASRTNTTTKGNPVDAGGSSTEVGFTASAVGTLTQSYTTTVTAGEIWTLSVWAKLSAAVDEPTDIQLRILSSAGTVLKKRAVRVSGSKWTRYSVSVVVPSNDTAIQGRFWKAGWATANAVYMWGAQLNKGGLAPYLPTPNATATAGPGAISGPLQVHAASPARKTLVLKGAVGQTANIFEIQDDSGNVKADFRNDGVLEISQGQINLGADVNLYRSAADIAKTDDRLVAAGGIDTRVVATASLPAAGASMDGHVLIEDAGAGDRNLIIYAGGQRFRLDGGVAF